ncbi:unnamed protein product [Leuciscus chuanchicus]
MVACCCFAIAVPSNFTEPCQGDVIAAELSGQQGGSSGAKECLDIPCGDSGPATKVDLYSLVGGRLGSVTVLGSPATFSDRFRNKRVSPGDQMQLSPADFNIHMSLCT